MLWAFTGPKWTKIEEVIAKNVKHIVENSGQNLGIQNAPPPLARNSLIWVCWESPIPVPRPVPQQVEAPGPFKSVAQQPIMLIPIFGTDAPYYLY